MKTKQWVIAALVLVAIAAFVALDLGRYLSLDYLKQSQQGFTQ